MAALVALALHVVGGLKVFARAVKVVAARAGFKERAACMVGHINVAGLKEKALALAIGLERL